MYRIDSHFSVTPAARRCCVHIVPVHALSEHSENEVVHYSRVRTSNASSIVTLSGAIGVSDLCLVCEDKHLSAK